MNKRGTIRNYIARLPAGREFNSTEIARVLNLEPGYVSGVFTELYKSGEIIRVGSEPGETGTRLRHIYTNTKQVSRNTKNSKLSFYNNLLQSFSDEQLIEEVRRRMVA